MDRIIKRFDVLEDRDLMRTFRGVSFQRDMSKKRVYDEAYFDKCAGYEGKDIANCINQSRMGLVGRYHSGLLLDIGIGSGEFVKRRPQTMGFDVNKAAIQWLCDEGLYSDVLDKFQAFTFWDVLEHCEDPGSYLLKIPKNSYVFASVPLFDLDKIRESKHYRPDEHLYYFTTEGMTQYFRMYGYRLLEVNDAETVCGRERIGSFAFQKTLPDYNDLLGQYKEMHATRYYGASASLYLEYVAPLIRELNPAEILDYGCGRSDLAVHFWNDGERVIARYDPAIPEFNEMPGGYFDLVLCCDVMEHIPILGVDHVLSQIRKKSRNRKAIFVISMKKARARLPNGDNAHVTLLSAKEWKRWIVEYFGAAIAIKTKWDHVLLLKTWR